MSATSNKQTNRASVRPDAAQIVEYIAALESIIKSLPGRVTINGQKYSNEAGIAILRRHFDVVGLGEEGRSE